MIFVSVLLWKPCKGWVLWFGFCVCSLGFCVCGFGSFGVFCLCFFV